MPTRLSIAVPDDFDLPRDACSYGYFLLAPNLWNPDDLSLSRPLDLDGGPAAVRISQPSRPGGPLRADADRTLDPAERKEVRSQVVRMLRLDEGASHAARFHALDPRFKKAGRFRLFRSPTLFEDVIKTVTSCNVTWTSTILMNRRLCECFGRGGSFPSAPRLARTPPALLRGRCSVGYRDRRIVEIARLFTGRSITTGATPRRIPPIDARTLENPAASDQAVLDSLLALPGIGPYAAANIMQLLGRYSRLPLDTESVRHGRTILGFKGSPTQIMNRVRNHFAPMGDQAFRSYWFELWTYYESRHGPAWTWQRDSTGRLFTAAQLKK